MALTSDLMNNFGFKLEDSLFHNARVAQQLVDIFQCQRGPEAGCSLVFEELTRMLLTRDGSRCYLFIDLVYILSPDLSEASRTLCQCQNLVE